MTCEDVCPHALSRTSLLMMPDDNDEEDLPHILLMCLRKCPAFGHSGKRARQNQHHDNLHLDHVQRPHNASVNASPASRPSEKVLRPDRAWVATRHRSAQNQKLQNLQYNNIYIYKGKEIKLFKQSRADLRNFCPRWPGCRPSPSGDACG